MCVFMCVPFVINFFTVSTHTSSIDDEKTVGGDPFIEKLASCMVIKARCFENPQITLTWSYQARGNTGLKRTSIQWGAKSRLSAERRWSNGMIQFKYNNNLTVSGRYIRDEFSVNIIEYKVDGHNYLKRNWSWLLHAQGIWGGDDRIIWSSAASGQLSSGHGNTNENLAQASEMRCHCVIYGVLNQI